MERCKYVEYLATIRDLHKKMDEVEGEIVFCESKPFNEGASLTMKLKGFDGMVKWIDESKMPIPAVIGQTLRGFYVEGGEGRVIKGVIIDAYKLLEGDKVLRRGKRLDSHKFVDGN